MALSQPSSSNTFASSLALASASVPSNYFPPHRTQLPPRGHTNGANQGSLFSQEQRRVFSFLPCVLLSFLLLSIFLLLATFLLAPTTRFRPSDTAGPTQGESLLSSATIHSVSSSSSTRYAIIIDAGSTGSRAHVFAYDPPDSPSALPRVHPNPKSLKIKPGLSSLASSSSVEDSVATYLEPLIRFAKGQVPAAAWPSTPIQLMATAGLRRLDHAVSNSLLTAARRQFSSSVFDAGEEADETSASVISGSEEGVFAWVTANYARGSLGKRPEETAGILELGGASAQLTFVPDEPPPEEYREELTLGGMTYQLYSHSFLNFGQEVAEERVETELLDKLQEEQQQELGRQEEQVSSEREVGKREVGAAGFQETGADGGVDIDRRRMMGSGPLSDPDGSVLPGPSDGPGRTESAGGGLLQSASASGQQSSRGSGRLMPLRGEGRAAGSRGRVLATVQGRNPCRNEGHFGEQGRRRARVSVASSAVAAAAAAAAGPPSLLEAGQDEKGGSSGQMPGLLLPGSGNFSECRRLCAQLLHPAAKGPGGGCRHPPERCGIGGAYLPEVHGHQFFATGNFFFTPRFLGLLSGRHLEGADGDEQSRKAEEVPGAEKHPRRATRKSMDAEDRSSASESGPHAPVKENPRALSPTELEEKVAAIEAAGAAHCATHWTRVVADHTERTPQDLAKFCFSSAYVVSFLRSIFSSSQPAGSKTSRSEGRDVAESVAESVAERDSVRATALPNTGAVEVATPSHGVSSRKTELQFVDQIGDFSIDWPLGALIIQLSSGDSSVPFSVTTTSSFVNSNGRTHTGEAAEEGSGSSHRVPLLSSPQPSESTSDLLLALLLVLLLSLVFSGTWIFVSQRLGPKRGFVRAPTIFDLEKGRYYVRGATSNGSSWA